VTLTLKLKVWKILKKVKKTWFHELKCATSHYHDNVNRQGERQTENHWHGTADLKHIHYTTRTPPLE